jgi:DNA mismatch repair ATPase MutS
MWASRGGGGFAADPVGLVFEYLNLMFFLDANALYFGSRELARRAGELRRVIDAVGQVDAAIAVASWRTGTPGWTRPVFAEDGAAVRMDDIRNPLIEDCVPNELRVAPRGGWLITGSNMSGKTTFLRTVGVNAVLAQTIYSCPADRYEAPPFVIRSCIGRADNLLEGRSYYLAEVESVLDIAREARTSRSCLCLFDELFRGTNVIERLAAGEAVLRALVSTADPGGSTVVLTATHDGELVEMLEDIYLAVHFGDRVGTDGLEFDYRLREGPATSRNAIALLRLQGAPPELVERAERTARELDDRSRPVDRRV